MHSIYLDYNGATPLCGAARLAITPYLNELFAEPHGDHWSSRAVTEAIEDARCSLAMMLGAITSEIVFTSGNTESCNLALLGAAKAFANLHSRKVKSHMVIGGQEHPAVERCAEYLESTGWEVTRLPLDEHGLVQPRALVEAIRRSTKLISVQLANRYTGTIQPIAELTEVKRPSGCLFHCDASQALGKMPVGVDLLGVDMLSLSGNVMYAPRGTGALYIRSGVMIEPIMYGGWQESGLRPGSENIIGIVGLGAASQLIQAAGEEVGDKMLQLREAFSATLVESCEGLATIGNDHPHRLSNTLLVRLNERLASDVVQRVPELNLAVVNPALGHVYPEAERLICVSLGWNTTEEEIRESSSLLGEAIRFAPATP